MTENATRDRERLDVAFEEIFSSFMANIHTAMPAQVTAFDADSQTVSVQPVLKRKYKDVDDPVNLPIIEDVPIVYPGSGDYWITFPVEVDSYVLLVFSERALDKWAAKGGTTDPGKKRRFALSDAIAIPGLLPADVTLSGGVDDGLTLRKKDGTSYLNLGSSGQVDINGNFTVDV